MLFFLFCAYSLCIHLICIYIRLYLTQGLIIDAIVPVPILPSIYIFLFFPRYTLQFNGIIFIYTRHTFVPVRNERKKELKRSKKKELQISDHFPRFSIPHLNREVILFFSSLCDRGSVFLFSFYYAC